jgi:alpha-beta hydrolase superfamily lysophospholipase
MIAWRNWSSFAVMLSAVALVAFAAGTAGAQDATPPAANRPAAVEIAPKTRDNVQLAATFYPAPTKMPDGKALSGKEVVPVILLHGLKGSRADMHALALKLQDAGHAALAIDLRGHGGSKKQALPGGKERTINSAQLTKNDVSNMVQYDVEAGKKYLMERNNAGELNIDKLCIVGADLGAVVAANWAVVDWSWPPLATGKQGQDVKAVVLLSPPKNVRGMAIMPALLKREIASKLSWLVVYGEQESDAKDAKTAAGQLEKWLPMPSADEAKEKQALFIMPLPTNLQGTKLLSAENFNVAPKLMSFIDLRLVKKSHPWVDRKTIP